MTNYLESIQRFAPDAKEEVVGNIVKHRGIALQSADASTVAATDQSELDAIRDGFCKKHLELEPNKAEDLIAEDCEVMKFDSAKSRVTFYYLLADRSNKLDLLA